MYVRVYTPLVEKGHFVILVKKLKIFLKIHFWFYYINLIFIYDKFSCQPFIKEEWCVRGDKSKFK